MYSFVQQLLDSGQLLQWSPMYCTLTPSAWNFHRMCSTRRTNYASL